MSLTDETIVTPDYSIEMFYDGECPLCMRETRLLQRLDRKQRIRFTDIAAADFYAVSLGKTQAEMMEIMHGRLSDGTWVTGVEVFRQLYTAVGFGFVARLTRLPIIKQIMQLGYTLFAKNRLRLTGRCQDGCAIQRTAKSNEQRISVVGETPPSQ